MPRRMPDTPSATSPDLGASTSIPASIQVRNVAFTLVSIAIVILLLQFMQPVFLPLVLAACCFTPLTRPWTGCSDGACRAPSVLRS